MIDLGTQADCCIKKGACSSLRRLNMVKNIEEYKATLPWLALVDENGRLVLGAMLRWLRGI